ncbi:MAG: O-antigen ligase family protein, partial [Lachnospiraceae bacterium]|nr:O-antigen ligase family protein [Lachnospiraceae bacterium]
METDRLREKLNIAGCITLMLSVVIQTILLWNEYSWYEVFAPYGTLITLVFLSVSFICLVKPREALYDPLFYAMAAGILIAGINILVTDSGKGAFLTAADVLIMIYLADKIKLPKAMIWFACVYVGFYFYYWTFDVKGYFKGYNTNYGGLVLITGFVFALTGLVALYEMLKKSEKNGSRFIFVFILFMFLWGYNIIAWYRARCALLGLVVFAILMLVPMKVWANRVFYALVTFAMTAGAILISLAYVWLGRTGTFDIQIFYKDVISGRDAIWADLWSAFVRMPLTGIGSSYKINVDWMGGMFEVHNGLLDILIVHGAVVFAITIFMLVKRLLSLREKAGSDPVA